MSNSNIHGVSDNFYSNNNNNQNYSNDNSPVFARNLYKGDPKAQSIPSFLKETLCPCFSFKSFSFIIIVINIVIYIITLIPHGLSQNDLKRYFLPPNEVTLETFGNLWGYKLRKEPVQFYRWITHNLLHAHFEHVISNNFCILIFGTILEYLIGTWRYIIIYCVSGILGGLFSALIKPEVASVGASICCYGVVAALLGFDFINWKRLGEIYGINNKCLIITFPLIMVIFTLPLFFSTTQGSGIGTYDRINYIGHCGGIIFGLCLSLFIVKPKEETDSCGFGYKIYFYFGIASVAVFTLVGFLCFYLMDKYVGF
jgi:membrane associated rhomboid family serine protease